MLLRFSRSPLSFRPHPLVSTFVVLSLLAACGQEQKDRRSGLPEQMVPGSFKVSMDENLGSPEDQVARLNEHASVVAGQLGCELEQVEPIEWQSGALTGALASSYHVRFQGCSLREEQMGVALAAFEAREGVTEVEAESLVRLKVSENDPLKNRQYYLGAIKREAACDQVAGQKVQDVIVAVVDSGVDADHPDLVDSFLRDSQGNVIGANFVGKGSRGQPDSNWDDRNGHGTHVAGLIGATASNAQGIAGVASCAKVKIMPIRVMGADGTGSSLEIDRGVQWAIAQGADIINLSLGSNTIYPQKRSSHPSALYTEAAARNVIVFAAAGNDGATLGSQTANGWQRGYVYSYPAGYDKVISVAATDARNRLTGFSNRGETVDIAAPGDQDLSTYVGGGYSSLSGTSMASPVAAGAYALVLSAVRRNGQDRISYNDLQPLLQSAVTGSGLSKTDVASGGVIDASLLLKLVREGFGGSTQPLPLDPTPPTQPTQPTQPSPVTPAPSSLEFVGLKDGQALNRAIRIRLQGWPKGQTARIYLYWGSSQSQNLQSFTSLTRANLQADGVSVVTDQSYVFYGNGVLIAEAVDSSGKRLAITQVQLRGL